MRITLGNLGTGKLLMLPLALYLVAVILMIAYLLAGSAQGSSLGVVLGGAAMIMIVVAGPVTLFMDLLALIELGTSKNDTWFKLIWAVVVLFLPAIGLVAYSFIGRKKLED